MEDKRIQSILQEALEEEIPASQVDLWPAVKSSLVVEKHQLLQPGEKMNTQTFNRFPRIAFTLVVVIALLVIAFATPQGRSFARSVWQYFNQAEGTSFALQPSQKAASETDLLAPTAQPPKPLVSVAEAEELVDFEVAELPFVPEGFTYLGARLYGNTINIEYQTPDQGGHLSIQQSRQGFVQSEWDQVPAEAIIPVKIGDLDGEFVQGTFVVYPGENSATWNPQVAMLRLRWKQDGVWFEMAKYGNVKVIEYLDQAEMIKLAESLSIQPK